MAINLTKHKDSLLAAWKDVLDDKSMTDWALFGYDGQSNDLKFISKGGLVLSRIKFIQTKNDNLDAKYGGVEELTEDLNSGKIMYAFCKVMDPKTSLPKCVLINWQGEGAPHARKGTCANHVHEVTNFFKGVHVTLNARNEEEVDPQIVIDKVAKSTGSAYSFKDHGDLEKESGPVGTVYKRVIPKQEINTRERDKFWEKEEQEEKQRQAEEKNRKEEERTRIESERKQRELKEAAVRERRIKERTASISQLREAEKSAEERTKEVTPADQEKEDWEREERERRGRSEILRKERSKEAQNLISKRTFNARAVFEQNTSAGQLNSLRRSSLNPDQEPVVNYSPTFQNAAAGRLPLPSWPPADTRPEQVTTPLRDDRSDVSTKVTEEESHLPLNNVESHLPLNNVQQQQNTVISPVSNQKIAEIDRYREHLNSEEEQDWSSDAEVSQPIILEAKQPARDTTQPQTVHEFTQPQTIREATQPIIREALQVAQCIEEEELLAYSNGQDDLGLQARALYDYQAADSTEITFDPGDVITHIDQIDEGWWQGLGPDGTYGLFPANYVELLN